jgi:hypothetical protein
VTDETAHGRRSIGCDRGLRLMTEHPVIALVEGGRSLGVIFFAAADA